MRKLLFLFFFFLSTLFLAQVEMYHRVKIRTGTDGLLKLAQSGVTVDHGEIKKSDWYISEFSDTELGLIKSSGLPYEVLITDMTQYYAERNTNAQKTTQATGICNGCGTYSTPSNFTLGTMAGFYTYNEMLKALDSMAAKFPNLITVRQQIDTGRTYENRPLYFVKISDNPAVAETEPQILYTSLHHAREPESLTQLIFYMWYLLENYGSDPEIAYLVNNLEMYFVPCVNPDGYIYNQSTNPGGGGMWRKNRVNNGDGTFGVDLNRNYGYNWGFDNFGSSPNTNSDTYRGPSAFSERETQMIMRFCNTHTFLLALNNHTYGNVLVQPYGYSATAYTPDSLTFTDYGMRLTYCDGFTYGSAMQTVGYTANGVSDDWMYGEQTSKAKILSMTPEAGTTDDGFWPVQSNITPIARNTMSQNITLAKLASIYAEVSDQSGPFIQQGGYIVYNIKRLGLQPGTFTVSVTPIGANFSAVGASNVHAGLAVLQSKNDSISYSLVGGIAPGTLIKFVLRLDNGAYILRDTITRAYGYPTTIFSDNCSATTQWTGTSWGTSSIYAVSPTKSMTDSPGGDYGTNWNRTFTTVSNINLTTAVAAYLEYYARWELEKNWDYVEIEASTNGVNFTPLCARFTHPGNSAQDSAQPLYDGFQRFWVKERIDLSAYLGQNIRLRFKIISDGGVEYDGFYFDDIMVKVLYPNSTGIASTQSEEFFNLYPNPNYGKFIVQVKESEQPLTILITDLLGRKIFSEEKKSGIKEFEIDAGALPAGTYLLKLQSGNRSYFRKFAVEN